MIYRVFPLAPGAAPTEEGGPLFVPRALQGSSRHDNPEHYGALYASRVPESAVAERIQAFRGRQLTDVHFQRADGRRYALASIDESGLADVVDLDDPAQLLHRALRPSLVATRRRSDTQPIALGIFQEGASGLGWWSTLEASWANVTLFAERATPSLRQAGPPELLTVDHPVVRTAAELLGVSIAAVRPRHGARRRER